MTKEELLRETELFLLDLDGTVYLDETPIGDMKRTLAHLREMGKKLVFLTNNSSKTQAEYVEKLTRIGLFDARDSVYTSGMATVEYLKEHCMGQSVYLVGTERIRAEFSAAGIVLDEETPDVCVLAYDVELTFAKIRRLDRFLRMGKPFYATHPDDVCPTADGSMPDVGSFLAMFERSSGRVPDAVIGKPYPVMAECLSRSFGIPRGRMCMVGDRMHTDIRFGNGSGMHTVLVLSGETTRETMGKFPDRPNLLLNDFNELLSGD